MNYTNTEKLLDFIEQSPTSYHSVAAMERTLQERGYIRLSEGKEWELEEGGEYYCIRGGSSLIAFRIPSYSYRGFQIMASHSDSPCLKLKENPDMVGENIYLKLNVEKYGGMMLSTWFDRPLSVAGRIVCREGDVLRVKLVDMRRDLLMIPSLAIHMNRQANEGTTLSVQSDMQPIFALLGEEADKISFMELVAREVGVAAEDILGSDLYVYNRMPGTIWGAGREFISSGRLDDLECVFCSLTGFLHAREGESIPVHVVFDNEEVGSMTRQGAGATFLYDTLLRINHALGGNESDFRQKLASTMMLSMDNAHATHPNYPQKACPSNRPVIGGGVVLKFAANQKYTSDGVSAALFREICDRAEVPVQVYTNHSDVRGGSTLGNIAGTKVSVLCADIGLAQLAMHSSYETAGVADVDYLVKAAKAFYESSLEVTQKDALVIHGCLDAFPSSGSTTGKDQIGFRDRKADFIRDDGPGILF